MGVPGVGGGQPPRWLGKQSQSGNIRFTVGQYWLIIKINGTNSVNFVGNSVNFVGNIIDILYKLDSASNYSAIKKLKPSLQTQDIPMK
jgi:hypothetical protein